MLELLSPAGSAEAVIAAVQNGADAIYLGLDGFFNARRGAKNFSQAEFLDAVQYCHARGCKVYVTLNTLVSDREMADLAELGRFVSEAGADAALVQDLGAARVLRAYCPDLPLHASTQMSIHNLAGVYAAAELGMRRAVLARELTREQIRAIAKHAPIELEVFVHGALCFCHSGQCYLSSLIGRRSGNRGMCAQPCRMQYSMSRNLSDYPLSLKDNCLVDYLAELEEMGIACVKIEGRMKRPEYTAIVTQVYHKAIHEGVSPGEKEKEMLRLAFSREGFTDGYYTGDKRGMQGVRSEAEKEAKALFAEARKAYAAGEMRRVDVDFQIAVRRNQQTRLAARDGDGNLVAVAGAVPEQAVSSALSAESVSAQLYKTGGTPYRCGKVSAEVESGLYLPTAALNELRRAALDALSEKRQALPRRRTGTLPTVHAAAVHRAPLLNLQVSAAEQLSEELAALRPNLVYVPLELLAAAPKGAEVFRQREIPLAAVLPRVITDSELETAARLLAAVKAQGVTEVLAGNLGQLALAKRCGFAVRGDFGLNVFNSHTLQALAAAGLKSATASFELRLAQVRDLVKPLDTELILYGRLPAMVSDQCILSKEPGKCGGCDGSGALSDRMGSVFPVMKEFGCRNVIYNAHKLFLADKMEDVLSCGLWAGRLLFTTESARECAEVTRSYLGQNEYRPNGLTRGLYYRGVE